MVVGLAILANYSFAKILKWIRELPFPNVVRKLMILLFTIIATLAMTMYSIICINLIYIYLD